MSTMSTHRPTAIRHSQAASDDVRARFVAAAHKELDRAYRLAGLILGSAMDAEDVVQDALLIAWRSYGSPRDPDRFAAWLDRILVNACRDRLRRRKVVRFVALDQAIGGVDDPCANVLARDAVLRHIATLPANERAIVVLHYWADLPLEGVAARLELPVGTVKSQLHRALLRMRTASQAMEEPA